MLAYLGKRIALIIPTLLGILLLNFIIVQTAPGGPVEQMMNKINALGEERSMLGGSSDVIVQGARPKNALFDEQFITQLNHQFGFDKPLWQRFIIMVKDYSTFNFGDSFFRGASVGQLLVARLPVTLSLGLWTMLLMYLISIPLGIAKAMRHGSRFDSWTSSLIIVGYAVPGFLFASLLIVFFAGGQYFHWFPLRGLTSANYESLATFGKIKDYFHHITLPVLANTIGSFATLTLLTKNSFLDEIHRQYVLTARAKGANWRQVLYGHVFRNAMLIVIAGLPGSLIGIFLTSSLLIEYMFSLDGLGLLGYESLLTRDYPVIFGTLFLFTLIHLVVKILSDLVYLWVDPRITFESHS
ncbi:microcin C ABC transporter permease YejB [Biostraticola tofi]|uniref:Microcin C transport system permease protein n=1 Tax=Biostraticola tofi TaxID=466109 RepID=A0A4R3Z041_9GAMM|nr:microcin C ABC transporter permease YejB [Biostraticola tofi]TCV98950.1 microcin C transport system permease protein [Biostraticola tofi]